MRAYISFPVNMALIVATAAATVTTRSTLYRPQSSRKHRFLVAYHPDHREAILEHVHRGRRLRDSVLYDLPGTLVVNTHDDGLRAAMKAHPRVLHVEEDHPRHVLGMRSLYNSTTAANRPGVLQEVVSEELKLLGVPKLWNEGHRGDNMTVCIIDTGMDSEHFEFGGAEQLSGYQGDDRFRRWDRDSMGHGTFVAGIIGAQQNGIGMLGVAPNAKMHIVNFRHALRTSNGVPMEEGMLVSDFLYAINHCREVGAKVINMSFGGPQASKIEHTVLRDLFNKHGVFTVSAVGNFNENNLDQSFNSFPASYRSVLSVGAVDLDRKRWIGSNYNKRLDVMAPGDKVTSTLPFGPNDGSDDIKYAYFQASGTSFASAYVSGIAALLFQAAPTATPRNVRLCIEGTAAKLGDEETYGRGLVDASRAVHCLTRIRKKTDGQEKSAKGGKSKKSQKTERGQKSKRGA